MYDFNESDKNELVHLLQKRLRWHAYKATAEEFNYEELQAVIKLLNILSPVGDSDYFNSACGLQRFWNYYMEKEQESHQDMT